MAETNKTQDVRLKTDIASFKASVAFLLFCAVIFFTVTYLDPGDRNSLYVKICGVILDHSYILLIFPVLLGLSCLWKYLNTKKKKDESYRYFASGDAIAISLFLLIFSLTITVTTQMSVFLTMIAGFALCYYVKHFFQKDFLVVTLLNLDIALALWLLFGSMGTSGGITTVIKIIFALAALLGFIGIIIAVFMILKNKKKYGAEKLSFVPIVISTVVGAALAALLYLLPATITILVAEIVLLIQFVGLGVYYTVRLLNQ